MSQRGCGKSPAFDRSGRVTSEPFVHFKETHRRDALHSRLNREPVIVQEPEARWPDGQASVFHISTVKVKNIVHGEDRGRGWTSPCSFGG